MVVSRVAIQAATAQLAVGAIFADSNGLLISNSGVKVSNFSRDVSLASSDQAVTGVGFKPVAVLFLASIGATYKGSWGFDDGAIAVVMYNLNGTTTFWSTIGKSIQLDTTDGVTGYYGKIKTLDSDGFTIQWTKVGAPTGTADIRFIALR